MAGEQAGAIPVGGVYASVNIDTGNVRPDMEQLRTIFEMVDTAANGFIKAIRDASAAMASASSPAQAMAAAVDTYSVAAVAGTSNAKMFAEATWGYSVAAVEGASNAQRFAAGIKSTTTATQESVAVDTVKVDSTKKLSNAHDEATRSQRKFQYGLIQVAYVMDDAQYGMRALTNNVGALASSFGGPLAGSIAIVGTGAMLLYNHWNKLGDLITVGIPYIQSNADRMKELGDNTAKTAAQTAEYNKLKREQDSIERTMAARKTADSDHETAVNEAIAESGEAPKMIGQLQGVLGRTTNLDVDEYAQHKIKIREEALKKNKAEGADPEYIKGAEARLEAAKKEANDARQEELYKRAANIVQTASTDKNKLKVLQGYVQKNEGAFDQGTADRLANVDETKQNAKDIEDDQSENKRRTEKSAQKKKQTQEQIEKAILESVPEAIAGGKTVDKAFVKEALGKAGFGNLGEEVVEAIFKKVEAEFTAAMQKGALAAHITPEEFRDKTVEAARVKAANADFKGPAQTAEDKAKEKADHDLWKSRESARKSVRDRFAASLQGSVGKSLANRMRARSTEARQRPVARAEDENFTDQQLFDQQQSKFVKQGMKTEDADVAAWKLVNAARKKMDAEKAARMGNGGQAAADRLGGGGGIGGGGEDKIVAAVNALSAKIDGKLAAVADNTKKMTNGIPAVLT